MFLRAVSVAPASELEELKSVRNAFRGFDGLITDEKTRVLSVATERIGEIMSRFEDGSPAQPRHTRSGLVGSIDSVKGVGRTFSSLLAKKGVFTVLDALFFFPHRYEDRRNIKEVSSAEPNMWQTVKGRVESARRTRSGRGAQFRVVLQDGKTTLDLVWFHFDERYMREKYTKGKLVIVSGEVGVDPRGKRLQILHPSADRIEVLSREDEAEGSVHLDRIVPVYPLTEGLGQRRLRTIMKTVSEQSGLLDGIMPRDCAQGLIPLAEAVRKMHFPENTDVCPDFSRSAWESGEKHRDLPAPRTVAFFEFFLLRLAIEMRKRAQGSDGSVAFGPDGELSRRFTESLPFEMTDSQKGAALLIRKRMESSEPMNVLLQGDVGSGKTVVALQAVMKALDSGYQAALMAPTQILAEQHARFISAHTRGLGIKTAVLKGGGSDTELEASSSGGAHIVVGTHALIYERVRFKRLGLVVVDEQHKFGVAQRDKLAGKGLSPDILVMTATPIPRSLAMAVYGDLEVVSIKELPDGRKPVETMVLGNSPEDRRVMKQAIRDEIEAGRQCYFICPLIETDGTDLEITAGVFDAASDLRKDLHGTRVAVLHGRMPPEEKDSVMDDFHSGATDVLVSTTVVEVGIDVPSATLVVIENADRFGMSQIHQLRGRVGRGSHRSRCILLKSPGISEQGAHRLEVLSRNSDGFSIAETDLLMRGPGEFLGTKQSGAANFRFADLIMDSEVLSEAQAAARKIVDKSPELENYQKLREMVQRVEVSDSPNQTLGN